MRRAHENDGSFLGHLPATPRVHFAKEELDQYRESPQEGIVDIFVHGRDGLLSLRLFHHCRGAALKAMLLVVRFVYGGKDT